ncbi:uncharacterized protein LOC134218172 [Armigeres subalbatus]|uniref:uncharacterized protein LOC134218172 n=1 Tax=Armigeres subalbatus TaxID=124917 RepID=UPI002ED47DB4
MNRYKFYNRSQGHSESSENFVLAVKLLAENCNFRDFKDEAVRDKLILGLRDKILQQKLLMEDDIALDAVEKTIISSELAGKRAKEMNEQGEIEVLSIKHRLGRKREEFRGKRYEHGGRFRSRSISSDRNNSKERNAYQLKRDAKQWGSHNNAVCNLCKRRGHIRKNCWFLSKKNTVKFVEQEKEAQPVVVDKFNRMNLQDSSDESDINCMKISGPNTDSGACLVEVLVNNKKLTMEIDTGSAVTVISEFIYKKLFNSIPLTSCHKKLVVVNGTKLDVVGQIVADILLNERKITGKLIVLKTHSEFRPLLGRDLMTTFYPKWKNAFIEPIDIKKMDIDKKHDEAIRFEADLVFTSDRPIFRKPYQVPYKIKEKFLKHLDDLEKQDIITPIQASASSSAAVFQQVMDQVLKGLDNNALGSHVLTAHRHQLKCLEQPKRITTLMAIPSQPRRRGSVDTEDDFFGFPDEGSNWTIGPKIKGVESVSD